MDSMISFTSPFYLLLPLVVMSMIPFLAVMGTSFLKLVVVFSILRNATGLQQIPPNIAMNALAIILSLYIMAPVGYKASEIITEQNLSFTSKDMSWVDSIKIAAEPYREFLKKNTNSRERGFFIKTAGSLWPEKYRNQLSQTDFMILMPAFCVSELAKAFQIGFCCIYHS